MNSLRQTFKTHLDYAIFTKMRLWCRFKNAPKKLRGRLAVLPYLNPPSPLPLLPNLFFFPRPKIACVHAATPVVYFIISILKRERRGRWEGKREGLWKRKRKKGKRKREEWVKSPRWQYELLKTLHDLFIFPQDALCHYTHTHTKS